MLSKKDKQGVVLLSIVGFALIAVLAVKLGLDKGSHQVGPDNCIGRATENTVIVLDHSERVAAQTLDEIIARASSEALDHTAVNGRVSIFTISDLSRGSLKPLISVCRPPEDGNRTFEDVRKIRKTFKEKFAQPIKDVLRIPPGNSKESPIAQALTDISLSQYLRGDTNRLIIFSDLLENTQKLSLYRCSSNQDVIVQFRESRRGAMERPKFRNTAIVVNLIPRTGVAEQTLACRGRFWPWFFGDNEGPNASVDFLYLPGGSGAAK